jgi:hypothetical protein
MFLVGLVERVGMLEGHLRGKIDGRTRGVNCSAFDMALIRPWRVAGRSSSSKMAFNLSSGEISSWTLQSNDVPLSS